VSNIVDFFKRLTEHWGGPPSNFPLPIRIFHSVLLICIAALIYNIPLNLIVGLPLVALVSAVTLVLVSLLYYLSRFLNHTAVSRVIFCVTGTCLFVINFFLNSGIDGPTGYFFLLMLVVMVAIVPVKQYWYWVSSNVLLLVGLNAIQYYRPEWVPYTYPEKIDRYVDNSSAYVTVMVIVLACFYITRKRYDSERQEAQQNALRLTELDAEKNKLFSIISHDLRSPLALIQNYLELLSEFDLSESERREIKAQLLQSTRGTLDMVNNVLIWSKSQMSGGALLTENLLLEVLLAPQIQLFKTIAARKEIVLEAKIAEKAAVWGNADMVQLIVRNLVNNAIKFTAAGGNILITVSRQATTTLLVVKDSGNGKPVQLTDDIFKLSSATVRGTANESGVGLGLLLCWDYTNLLGGRLWFKCDPQSGTSFFVELPLTNRN
jgi:two-component system sensor histidine kinase/response regulator